MEKSKKNKTDKTFTQDKAAKNRLQQVQHNDQMSRRFGAIAYEEDKETDQMEDDTVTLSFDAIRTAFAELDAELGAELDANVKQLTQTLPDIFQENDELENSELDEEEPTEPVYSETAILEEEDREKELGNRWMRKSEGLYSMPSMDDEKSVNPKMIVEAMLFVGDRANKPLDPHRAVEKMRNVTVDEIDELVRELNRDYRLRGCPYHIQQEPEGYRMVLRPEFEQIQNRFYGKTREARLSQQTIDTLAVVAYRQPISAEEVQKIRNQPSSGILSQLVRRGLLEIQREVRDNKKIVLYRTTDRFLELFQLESIDDLPIADELHFR